MKKVLAITMISMMVIASPSCIKKWSSGPATYSVKGRMLRDCSGAPIANYSLLLTQENGLMSIVRTDTLGRAVTDANGYFEIKNIPVNKSKITLRHDGQQSVEWLSTQFAYPKDGTVMDFGDFYASMQIKSKIHIVPTRPFSLTDTLFIGDNIIPGTYIALCPIIDTILVFGFNSTFSRKSDFDNYKTYFYYNVGWTYYDSLCRPNKPIGFENNRIFTDFGICKEPAIASLLVK